MTKALSDKKKKIVEGYFNLYPFEPYSDGNNRFCIISGIKLEQQSDHYDVLVSDAYGFFFSIGNGFILDLIYDAIVGKVLHPNKRILGKV